MGASNLPKILIVEENPQRREVFRNAFAGVGSARVLFASSMRSGIVALKKSPFDMLILHGDVARRNDYALLRAIRRDMMLDSLFILVFHPLCGEEISNAALTAGATLCATPAFEAGAVQKIVLGVLPQHTGEEQAGDNPPVEPVNDLEDAKRLRRLGMDMLKRGECDRAIKAFSAALKRNSTMPEALLGLGEAFAKLGDVQKAFRFRHSATTNFLLEERFSEAKMLHRRMGLPPKELEGKFENPFLLVGKQLAADGRQDVALRVFEEGTVAVPDDAVLQTELAMLYEANGDSEQAEHILEEAGIDPVVAKAPGSGGLHGSDAALDLEDVDVGSELDAAMYGEHVPRSDRVDAEKKNPGVQVEEKPKDWKEKRAYPRIPLADYTVKIGWRSTQHHIVDVSMGGICFKTEGQAFEHGQLIKFALMDEDGARVKKIQGAIRFVAVDRVGVQFLDLSARQQETLHTIIKNEAVKHGIEDVIMEGPTRQEGDKIIVDLDMW